MNTTCGVSSYQTSSLSLSNKINEDAGQISCIPALALAWNPPNGVRAIRTEPVCLDVTVINALGPDNWRRTAVAWGSAADHCSVAEAARNDSANKCQQSGYRFWPVGHEIRGTTIDADASIGAIAKTVGRKEGKEAVTVRCELRDRVAVVTARITFRIQKRCLPVRSRNPH